MFSSHRTSSDSLNLSVEYKNLYHINGIIYYFTNDDKLVLPYVNKFTNTYGWTPQIMYFSSESLLNEHLSKFVFKKIKLSAIGDNLWYGNIGHALWDGLYPVYVALVKFGYKDDSFILLSSDWHNKQTMSYDVVTKFSGNNLLEYFHISENIHFETLIAGTGQTGNRVMTSDYTLYGEKEYNALSFFKERLLKSYNINIDYPVNQRLKAIFINNKRYTPYERIVIEKVIEKYKNDTRINLKFIDWYHDYKSFNEQLVELENTDIHITGPGTGMLYMPFLKNGAVNVNLGYIEHTQTNTARPNIKIENTSVPDFLIPGYMEQAVCAAANYVSTIYYDRYENENLEIDALVATIEKAISIANKKEKVNSNHFVDAQIYIEYCKRCNNSDSVVNYLTGIAFFIELFINEHPVAIPSNIIDIDLLRKIKTEFNFNNKYQIIV